jgi:hypothetical protein
MRTGHTIDLGPFMVPHRSAIPAERCQSLRGFFGGDKIDEHADMDPRSNNGRLGAAD